MYPQRPSHGPMFQLPLLGYLHLTWPVPRTHKRAIISERKPGNVHDEASGCRPPNGCMEWLRGTAARGQGNARVHAQSSGPVGWKEEKKKVRQNWQKQSRGTEGGEGRGEGGT
ncbi:hypothetical protein COCMIDRAFT_22148 [Bipolaris oryzae ATCC 44560]|uniref:Uncharacterized protein n=1 Tax=Bipolaris oryzae ATCC 44560 TaxID=930090 RepID=W6ZRZ2_COCMI|nr:uncharacterized protein COCMIDRAFT_22148 [Bipolaris oryzae ATCC 44560]EUC50269.1 hypothetical protein COCMIDRAFT_22148 [Bipolaris oryzae ATCC 44560]